MACSLLIVVAELSAGLSVSCEGSLSAAEVLLVAFSGPVAGGLLPSPVEEPVVADSRETGG